MTEKYIVELQAGCYLADWEGDPGRTLKLDSAKRFNTKFQAKRELKEAQKLRGFLDAKIHTISIVTQNI